jgi:2-dehydropantoate 2-reductase
LAEDFTIIGAGAIGSIVGAHLMRAGRSIAFIEANADHVAAIRAEGLHLSGAMDTTIHPPVLLPHEVSGKLRHVLLAVKARHTEAALTPLLQYLDPDGYIVSLQNGLEEPKIAALAGADRTIGAFLTFGGHYRAPGDVVFGGPGTFRIGELDGRITERLLALRDALLAVQEVEVTANIAGYLWAKLALGAIYFATALVSADVTEQYNHPTYRAMFGALAGEVMAVAHACGIKVEKFDGFDANVFAFDAPGDPLAVQAAWEGQRRYWNRHEGRRTGVWRDLAQHGRQTEVDQQVGAVVDLSVQHGVAVPRLQALQRIVHEAETGARQLGYNNLDELVAIGGSTAL